MPATTTHLIPAARQAGPSSPSASRILPAVAGRSPRASTTALRYVLVAGCAIAAGSTFAFVDSGASAIDPDLVLLLHGMAAIKSLMVAGAGALVAWRFAHPVSPRSAAGYLVGMLLASAATALIWRLTWIAPAALVFHAGGLLLLVVAWRDDGSFTRWRTR